MITAALLLASALGAPQMKACAIGAMPARCGTYRVYEDRARGEGRTIDLHFIVIPAKKPTHRAIVFNPGGPGASSTADAGVLMSGQVVSEFVTLRDRYDVLLLDNRGTGQSAPQNCDIAPFDNPQAYFLQWWPDEILRQCRAKLAANANLSLYATPYAIEDLNDLRGALGYDKLVLDGGSYGTQFYLAFARAHPEHVESMVLRAVAPPHFYRIPLPDAGGFEASLDHLIAECAAEAGCPKRFPRFREEFVAVARRFDQGPVTVSLWEDRRNRALPVPLSREVFFERLRKAFYDPASARYVPVIIESAYHGDYAPLALLVQELSQSTAAEQANGLNLSAACAEDIPFITEAAVASSSAGMLEGDVRVRAEQHACRIWNVQPVDASFDEPVQSSLPTLMIAGSDDPATPSSYAREEMKYLSNGHLMIVKGGTHESDSPCVDKVVDRFVRTHAVSDGEMNKCAASYQRPPFATTLAYYQVGSQGNPAIATRLRSFIEKWKKGTLDRSQLTKALSAQYSPQLVANVAEQLASIGSFDGFRLLDTHVTSKGTTYHYAARARTAYFVATFTINGAGEIADMDLSP